MKQLGVVKGKKKGMAAMPVPKIKKPKKIKMSKMK